MSNGLDSDQDRHSFHPNLGLNVCKSYLQKTKLAPSKKRVKVTTLSLYSIGYLRSSHHFLFLENIEKIQEKFKLSFDYF